MAEEVRDRQSNVLGDLADADRGNVAALMERDGSEPAAWVPKLLVRASLSHLLGSQRAKDGNEFPRLE
jgi:hypothetical protein